MTVAAANILTLSDFEPRMETASAEAFRAAMRQLASGVALVTSANEHGPAGCAASSVCSLSLSPPSLLVCLNVASSTLRVIKSSGALTINILSERHESLARRFASPDVHGAERFAEGEWLVAANGAPRLRDALAVVECRVDRIVEYATHAIVIGGVIGSSTGDEEPALVHWRSRFGGMS